MNDKRGKKPYKTIISESVVALKVRILGNLRERLQMLIKGDEIKNLFYTKEEKEQIPSFIPETVNIQNYWIPGYALRYYCPIHTDGENRLKEVIETKLPNSEEIVNLVQLMAKITTDIERDKAFLFNVDDNKYGETVFKYAPILKKIIPNHMKSKFSDKAWQTTPKPEAYQWKLNGISTALTYLELNKD